MIIAFSVFGEVVQAGPVSRMADFLKRGEAKVSSSSETLQTMELLAPALNLDPNPAKGGGDIAMVDDSALLPETGPEGTIADLIEGRHGGVISTYIVREGDTISGIATMFGVSDNTVLWANNLNRSSKIKPGDTLVILPISGVRHTVAKGDTLASIVKKYKADLEEVLSYNEISANTQLAIGTVVTIPNGESPISTSSQGAKPASQISVRGTSVPSYEGYYMRPIAAGRRSQGLHGYNGVDLADTTGTPIYAAAAGTVIVSKVGGWNGGYGNYVVISHANGTQTLYAHASANLVSVGDTVEKGDTIALVGSTGRSTGPHVHFEIRGAKNPF